MRPARPLLVAIAVLASLSVTRAQDNPQATSGSWRPTIVAQHGMVAAGHPLAPAIEIADSGFPISEALAGGLRSARAKLAKFPSSTKIWFKDGKPLEMGDIVKNPDLARTLRTIAAQGADPFYRGDIAKSTVA